MALAEIAEPHLEGRDQVHWAAVLEHERANVHAAIHWAAARDDGETASRLVAALVWFLVISGHLREAKKLFDVALDTPGASTATLRAGVAGALLPRLAPARTGGRIHDGDRSGGARPRSG